MKMLLRLACRLILTLAVWNTVQAQESTSINYYAQIKDYDLSKILMADSFLAEDREGTKEKMRRAEPLGFIGSDYQRFYIHFLSMKRPAGNKYRYTISGKTRVRETIRPFSGTVTVKQAALKKVMEYGNYKQGVATCAVDLLEDPKQSSTGSIKGTLLLGFVIDNKGVFRYDALQFYADGFSNNTFKGNWTSYKTGAVKKCNWGDYRIPESGDLDVGAGEFSPDSKYFDKGWKYYILSLFGETETDVELGKRNEAAQWWK